MKEKEIKKTTKVKEQKEIKKTIKPKNTKKTGKEENKDELLKQKKKKITQFSTLEVVVLVIITCVISLITGSVVTNNTIKPMKKTVGNYPELAEFVENYKYITDNYYGEIDKQDMVNRAIAGMLTGLDDYSTYMDNNSNSQNVALEGSYKGLGIEVTMNKEGKIYISKIIEDSPAVVAELKPNDEIVSIDGISLKGKTTKYLTDYISKSKKNNFELSIIRDNKEQNIKVKKDIIILKSVTSKVINQNKQKTGYIYIDIFAENTASQFKKQLEQLEQQNINSLIIDVRNNGGGHLTSVSGILSLFLDDKNIIYKTEENGKTKNYYSTGSITKKYKIAILQNKESASGSELLAATLNEQLNAVIIGETSYGKGTVQEVKKMSNGSKYKLTTKKWLTPKGKYINEVGVKPTIELPLADKYINNPIEANDNQLQTALKELTKK